jgi:lipopolysaccharide exporter
MVGSVELSEWLYVVRLRLAVLRKIASYGLAVSLNGLANFAASRWDNLLVARFFGPAVMATYNLAYSLAEMPATYVGEQVTDVVQATFTHMERDERRHTLLRAIAALGLVTFPLAIGLGAVAPTLAEAFLDKKWAGVGSMLLVLSMLSVTRPTYGAVWGFIMVERGPRVLVLIEWLSLGALMAAITTVGRISPLWTCGAVGIVYTARMLAGMFLARTLSGVPISALLARFFPPLIACAPMVAAVFGMRFLLARLGVHAPVVRLAAEIASGALVFIGSAFVFAPGPAHELLSMVLVRAGLRKRPVPKSNPSPNPVPPQP